MYSYKLLENPGPCAAGCGRTVVNRLAGHYYREPMCNQCFSEAAPGVVEAVKSLEPACVRFLGTGGAAVCFNCGNPLASRLAGHNHGDPLCLACFCRLAPNLAGLLLLREAAVETVATGNAGDLLAIAKIYVGVPLRLDAGSSRIHRASSMRTLPRD